MRRLLYPLLLALLSAGCSTTRAPSLLSTQAADAPTPPPIASAEDYPVQQALYQSSAETGRTTAASCYS